MPEAKLSNDEASSDSPGAGSPDKIITTRNKQPDGQGKTTQAI